MFHYVGSVSGTDASRRLYALQDALIEVVQEGTDVPVAIFANEAGNPIQFASGYANRAIADNFGNYDFWVPEGTYDIKVYNAAGQSERRISGLAMYGAEQALLAAESASSAAASYQQTQDLLASVLQRLTALEGGTVTPTPAPVFTAQPSVSPASGVVGTTFLATPGAVANGTISSRAWLLDGTSISTGLSATPSATGTLTYQEAAVGLGGTAYSTVQGFTVSSVAPVITLNALVVAPATATIGLAYSATISGTTAGSTLALSGAGSAGLSITGTSITGTPSVAGSVDITETLAGATNSPRVSSGVVAVSPAAPVLGALTLSSSSATRGTSKTINILGATAGSAVTGTPPSGMTLNSAARTISGTPTTAATYNFNLTETLAGASNTPRVSAVTIVVAASPSVFANGTWNDTATWNDADIWKDAA
jgi:hypothetical protein